MGFFKARRRTRPAAWGRLLALAVGCGVGAGVVLGGTRLLGLDLEWTLHKTLVRLLPQESLHMAVPHPTHGSALIPNKITRHKTDEFDVLYTIGGDGSRRIPGARKGLPMVEFLGDSYTFGHGVEDEDVYPARLNAVWTGYTLRNRAVMGWCQVPNALVLDEDLARGDPMALVLYGWLYVHDQRSFDFLRGSSAPFPPWLKALQRKVEAAPSFGPGRAAAERDLGRALLLRMARVTRERGIPFGVVILAMPGWAPQENGANELIPFLEREGIPYVDLQHDPRFASRDGLQYPKDSHPTPEYHRLAALAIAERFSPGTPPGVGGRAPGARRASAQNQK